MPALCIGPGGIDAIGIEPGGGGIDDATGGRAAVGGADIIGCDCGSGGPGRTPGMGGPRVAGPAPICGGAIGLAAPMGGGGAPEDIGGPP